MPPTDACTKKRKGAELKVLYNFKKGGGGGGGGGSGCVKQELQVLYN